MHPIVSARLSETWASRGATLAQRMVFRILSHPESQHQAPFRMVRWSWNEQKEPYVGGLAIRIGCRTGLRCDLAGFVKGKRESPPFLFVGFHVPDFAAQRIHSGDDSAPERGRGARTSDINWALQKFDHRRGDRGMNEPLLRRTIFAFGVTLLRATFIIVVKKRLAVLADIVG